MKLVNKKYCIWGRMSMAITFMFVIVFISQTSCNKLIEVAPPVTQVNQENVYISDATAIAALTGIYIDMNNSGGYSTGDNSISVLTGLSSDELKLFTGVSTTNAKYFYYTNTLHANSSGSTPGTEVWRLYSYIFRCNAIIEGLINSSVLTTEIKQQLLGEARFMRAFFYFYLVNLYGDLPLVTGTDWMVNALLSRSSSSQIYSQIISDLREAQNLLSPNFLDASLRTYSGNPDRVRPTKWAATALLARTFLYTQKYDSAEVQSSNLINHIALFDTVSINKVFLKNSKEVVWQLQPIGSGFNTAEGKLFILPSTGPNSSNYPVYLSKNILNSFETGDQRAVLGNWINRVIYQVTPTLKDTAYYPFKYKAGLDVTVQTYAALTEYLMILRLSEQYLIRAEARAELGNISGALSDLNVIRRRAGLSNYNGATDKASFINAIIHERQVELFTEWGHRWFDLKRSNNIDGVMTTVCLQKGSTWQPFQQLYPIPLDDVLRSPNIVQNQSY